MIFSREYGHGEPLIIIHGLFGMSDNWNSLAKQFAKEFNVHVVDLRNHGRSFHSDNFSYKYMSEDIKNYIDVKGLHKPIIIGHSLGGKVAMHLCARFAELINKLIVVDIAPRYYSVDFHKNILDILSNISIREISSRNEIDEKLSNDIKEFSIRQFLMKNLYRNTDKEFCWRFNIHVLRNKLDNISNAEFIENEIHTPTLFIRGKKSNYINEADEELIQKFFINSKIVTVENAGHWVHAEQPNLFFESVMKFIN